MESTKSTDTVLETMVVCNQERAVRYNGVWYKISPKPFEPERQTIEIAWRILKGETQTEAYRNWYEVERKSAKVLYPSFRKDES
jgi:hypothetical protein